tara:strand:- start:699 stop:974 length:276 start_codon:yes stop_codon:yes gene_type:complete
MDRKKILFLISFLIGSFTTIGKIEAGLKDEYEKNSQCNWRTAQFQVIKKNPSNTEERICITSDNKIISIVTGTSCVGGMCLDYPLRENLVY